MTLVLDAWCVFCYILSKFMCVGAMKSPSPPSKPNALGSRAQGAPHELLIQLLHDFADYLIQRSKTFFLPHESASPSGGVANKKGCEVAILH